MSSAISAPEGQGFSDLSWKADVPRGTELLFQVRSSDSEEGLKASSWLGPDGSDSFYTKPKELLTGIREGEQLAPVQGFIPLPEWSGLSRPDGSCSPL